MCLWFSSHPQPTSKKEHLSALERYGPLMESGVSASLIYFNGAYDALCLSGVRVGGVQFSVQQNVGRFDVAVKGFGLGVVHM